MSPSLVANYVYELVKLFNSFYQSNPILKNEDENVKNFRLHLSQWVANTIETSLAYRSEEDLKKIYKAILRGTKAFIEEYNKNNIHNKIKTISVGTNRNSLLSYLDDNNHPKISGNFAINFGSYSLNGYGYSGDWRSQKLLLKI